MASKEQTLPIERRERTGTSDAHRLRAAGRIPGVLYGHGTDPVHLSFDARTFGELAAHGGTRGVLTLTLNGKKSDTAMVREVQRHPVSHKIEHVDLQRVSAHEAVHAKVPLVTLGVARGVKDFAGVMDVLVHEIELEGPVDELPDRVEVDVSDLGIHQHATAGDIKVPKNFKLLTPPDTIVVSVDASKTARLLEEAEAPAAAEQAQPELIGKPEESE